MAVDKRGRKLPKGVRQKGDRFEGRFTYQQKTYSVFGDTVGETQKKMNELRYKLEHGIFVERKKITLDDWFNTWLDEYKKNQVKNSTYANYVCIYRSLLHGYLGDKYISDIRGEHIQKFYNDLVKAGYSAKYIDVASALINGCMQQAFRNGMIDRNPVDQAERPRHRKKEERRVLSKEEQELFMKYAESSYLYNLFAVMLRTGMRGGEIRGLKLQDIDNKNKVIHVRRTLVHIDNVGFVENTPKTKSSTRDIPITESTYQILNDQKHFWGFKVEKMDRYLFCDENGGPLHRSRVQNEIDRIVERIRADGHDFDHISPHTFRHTFATRAIEAGMPPQVLKTILGHSSLAMTMDLYSHVLPDTKAMEMDKIDAAFM